MFTDKQLDVIDYCAQECYRQSSGEPSVYNMVNAWGFAHVYQRDEISEDGRIDLTFISRLGSLVEPKKNRVWPLFRSQPIYVGNSFHMVEKAPWERVPDLLNLLLESYYEGLLEDYLKERQERGDTSIAKTPEDQFYFEYETIHPFVDGNGRTGKILYNYLLGTLESPILPPNFWGSVNL